MHQRPRWLWIVFAASVAVSAGALLSRQRASSAPYARPALRGVSSAAQPACEDDGTRLLRPPSSLPAQLMCTQARLVADQVHQSLVQPPHAVDPRAFAMSVSDWLDPHGIWSASPDAPFAAALQAVSPKLLSSFEHPEQSAGCEAADQLGAVLASWVDELRGIYDHAVSDTRSIADGSSIAASLCTEPAFEDGPITHPARQLVGELGRRSALAARGLGTDGARIADTFRARLLPELSPAGWGEVVLAAALRAYVLHVDPHGAWAPLDEETSLYEVELEASGRTRMWTHMQRTVAGLRVDGPVMAPLQAGDVVLSVGPTLTAGLTVEQADQLGVLDPADPQPTRVVRALRGASLVSLLLRPTQDLPVLEVATPPSVKLQRIPYHDGEVFVLDIPDVPDDLGDQVEATLARAVKEHDDAEGLVLDLRGNGGGSIDGAKSALGLFLPGAPLFPMLRRDRTVELETAPVWPADAKWTRPVAMLVDGDTASAAEMIAGALQVYQRGVLVGSRTFGKGCAQEYVDDQAGVGVLRLTTLLYALPDGSPVQRVGLSPTLHIDPEASAEREAELENTFPTWRGPDVRRRAMMSPVPWPTHGGHIGPCDDPALCQALRLLGAPRPATARTRKP